MFGYEPSELLAAGFSGLDIGVSVTIFFSGLRSRGVCMYTRQHVSDGPYYVCMGSITHASMRAPFSMSVVLCTTLLFVHCVLID